MKSLILIKCPTCQKELAYNNGNPYRPFCSERCKLIDLGAWAAEEHIISEPYYDEQLIEGLELTEEEFKQLH